MNDNGETITTNEINEGKSNRGGARPGCGRPRGKPSELTLLRKRTEDALHERILHRADEIISNQLQLSKGHSYLYKIVTTKGIKGKPQLVKDQNEIIRYLAREEDCEGQENIPANIYYYITTEKPDNQAINSMLDRVFGKAVSRVEMTGKDGEELKGTVVYLPQINANDLEASQETGNSVTK